MIQERYIVTERHKLVIDTSWIGVDIHAVTDEHQLVEWWQKLLRVGGPVNQVADRSLAELQTALWVRVNTLYPSRALKFEDLESVNKLQSTHEHAVY